MIDLTVAQLGEVVGDGRESMVVETPGFRLKRTFPCCVSRRDELGRLPVGYCSPECERRPGQRRDAVPVGEVAMVWRLAG